MTQAPEAPEMTQVEPGPGMTQVRAGLASGSTKNDTSSAGPRRFASDVAM